jgi:starch phosphorylase
LSPDDVDVEVVHGRMQQDDTLADTTAEPLRLAETYEGGRHRFEGQVRLATSGSFGYTARILPKNAHLAGPAELGRITYPHA